MNKIAIGIAALAAFASSAAVQAAPCRDARGHFIKCTAPASAPRASASHAAAKARRTPCRDAHGRFVRCH